MIVLHAAGGIAPSCGRPRPSVNVWRPVYHDHAIARSQEVSPVKPVAVVGIVLIALGALALAYQGITYTTRESVVDLGPLKLEAKREKTIPLPPILGGAAVAAGIILVLVGARRG
jgi:hypothetical protein